jgi:hypothetical protein
MNKLTVRVRGRGSESRAGDFRAFVTDEHFEKAMGDICAEIKNSSCGCCVQLNVAHPLAGRVLEQLGYRFRERRAELSLETEGRTLLTTIMCLNLTREVSGFRLQLSPEDAILGVVTFK